MYQHLRSMGYFVEVLGAPITCFDASQYGTNTETKNRTTKWECFYSQTMELQAVVRGFSPRVFIVYGLEKDDKLKDYLLMCPFRHTLDGRQRGGVFSWGDHQAEERHRQRSVAHYLQRLVQHFCHEEGQVLRRKHQVLNSVVWQWGLR